MKRSYIRRITIENKILRHMRISKGLSLRQAGRIFSISGSAINHIEHGRMDIPVKRIEQMVLGYEFTMDDYDCYKNGENLVPVNLKDEAIVIIRKLTPTQLEAVYGILKSYLPAGSTL